MSLSNVGFDSTGRSEENETGFHDVLAVMRNEGRTLEQQLKLYRENQVVKSVETTKSIIQEVFQSEEKILPEGTVQEQYQFATSFLKVGDYNMAERAFREFVLTNPKDELSGNAQYWYAETFRIRQLYTDAASAYLEGYQKYP